MTSTFPFPFSTSLFAPLDSTFLVNARILCSNDGGFERRALTTAPPCWPVAPVTRMVLGAIFGVSGVRRICGMWCVVMVVLARFVYYMERRRQSTVLGRNVHGYVRESRSPSFGPRRPRHANPDGYDIRTAVSESRKTFGGLGCHTHLICIWMLTLLNKQRTSSRCLLFDIVWSLQLLPTLNHDLAQLCINLRLPPLPLSNHRQLRS